MSSGVTQGTHISNVHSGSENDCNIRISHLGFEKHHFLWEEPQNSKRESCAENQAVLIQHCKPF